jgi:hypothetical protein
VAGRQVGVQWHRRLRLVLPTCCLVFLLFPSLPDTIITDLLVAGERDALLVPSPPPAVFQLSPGGSPRRCFLLELLVGPGGGDQGTAELLLPPLSFAASPLSSLSGCARQALTGSRGVSCSGTPFALFLFHRSA